MPSTVPTPTRSRPCRLPASRLVPTLCLASCAFFGAATLPVRGQPADAKGQTWSQIEGGEEYKKFRDSMRVGDPLSANDATFLTQTLFPQLEAAANRPLIDRIVRRKLRDLQIVTDNPATLEQFTKLLVEFMVKVARDEKKEPIVRVNAALLVGELNDESRKRPWTGAAAPLVALVADPAISPEVRIAAASGLQRHATAAAAAGPQPLAEFAAQVAPALAALLAPPADLDRAAADWMATRGLGIVRTLGKAVPAPAAAAAARLLDEPVRPVDVRIRSAAAAGAIQMKDVEPAKVVRFAEAAALNLLKVELLAATERKQAAQGRPAGAEPAPIVRRHAARQLGWRLATLADAVFTDDTTGGFAPLLPDPAAVAGGKDLARRLRAAATDITDKPGLESLQKAIDSLTGAQPQPPPDQPPLKQPDPVNPSPEPDPDNPFK